MLPTSIPSPNNNVWYIGPVPIHAYAICILIGIVVAIWIGTRRWVARGGKAETVLDVALWMVPFGIVGGRLYHVITTPQPYFGPGGNPWQVFEIWEGGMGIWGAVALGAVGGYIGIRRAGYKFAPFADALAPALLVAQAIGRLGNWFNQELFGGPTTLPWGLQIDPSSPNFPAGYPAGTLFQPCFLYELIWDLGAAALLVYCDRKFRLGHGRVFWLYVVFYTAGRGWIEALRIDPAETFLGLRLNDWTCIIVGLSALIIFIVLSIKKPGRETTLLRAGRQPDGNVQSAPEPAGDDSPEAGVMTEKADSHVDVSSSQAEDSAGGAPRGSPPLEQN